LQTIYNTHSQLSSPFSRHRHPWRTPLVIPCGRPRFNRGPPSKQHQAKHCSPVGKRTKAILDHFIQAKYLNINVAQTASQSFARPNSSQAFFEYLATSKRTIRRGYGLIPCWFNHQTIPQHNRALFFRAGSFR